MLSPSSDFLSLTERKLEWLDERTRVLASNVANADTPGYKPHDLRPFSQSISPFELTLMQTDPADLAGSDRAQSSDLDSAGEQAPDGNAVSLEQQMKLVADTNAQQQFATTLYRKYIGLTMTALGAGGSSS